MSLSYGDGKVLLEDIRATVQSTIRAEMETLMSELQEQLAGYKADVTRQFEQIRDSFAPVIQALRDETADAETRAANALEAAQTAQADIQAGVDFVQAERSELQADDAPAEEPPTDENPPA